MRVEFIGCTSAGKSTLIAQLCNHMLALPALSAAEARAHPPIVVTSYNFVLQQCGFGWMRSHQSRMVMLNLIAFVACLVDLRTHWRALRLAGWTLYSLPATVSWHERANLARLVMRNLGIDTVTRWFDRGSHRQVILADEGTLQAVHYLFVHLAAAPDLDAVATWSQLVPLPDYVITVQQGKSALIARTLQRGHGRIPTPTVEHVTCFIERAVAVFDHLGRQPVLHERLFHFVDTKPATITAHAPGATVAFNPMDVQKLAMHLQKIDDQSHPLQSARPNGAGAVFAFIGPEATGKSTLVAATTAWLQASAKARSVHVGKPRAGWLTWPLQLVVPLLRKVAPQLRSSRLVRSSSVDVQTVETRSVSAVQAATQNVSVTARDSEPEQPTAVAALIYATRAVNVAWDRYRLLRSVRRLADRGELVICDRYPSVTVGAVDSPRLKLWTGEERTSPIVRALYNRIVQLEHALYRRMPDPDVVIRLTVSLEIAKQRNRNRVKADKADDRYLEERRNKAAQSSVVGRYANHVVSTDGTLDETIVAVQELITRTLQGLRAAQPEAEQITVDVRMSKRLKPERNEL